MVDLQELNKTDTPSTSSYQVQIAPMLVVEFHPHFSIYAGILFGMSLHWSHACCQNYEFIVATACCIWKTRIPGDYSPSLVLKSFYPIFEELSALRTGLYCVCPLLV